MKLSFKQFLKESDIAKENPLWYVRFLHLNSDDKQIYAAITDVPPTISSEQLIKLTKLSFPYLEQVRNEGRRLQLSGFKNSNNSSAELYHKEGSPLFDQDFKSWEERSKPKYVPMTWKEFATLANQQLEPEVMATKARVYGQNELE